MRHIFNYWLQIIFLISVVAITVALSAEYFFNLAPCKMCLKQRHAYYAIIIFIIFYYFFKKIKKIWLVLVIELALFYGLFFAIWHVGIEQNIIKGTSGCSGELFQTDSIANLKKQILNQDLVSCSEITWAIAGISATSLNSILMLLILIFNTIYIKRDIYGSKKD